MVQPVADDPAVPDREADVVRFDGAHAPGRLVEQHGETHPTRSLDAEPGQEAGHRAPTVQDVLDDEIMARFDHRDLDRDTQYFEKEPATAENLLLVIHRLLLSALPPGSLDRIRLVEDPDTWVELVEPAPDADRGAP